MDTPLNKKYHRQRRWIMSATFLLETAVLVGLLLTNLGAGLRNQLQAWGLPQWAMLLVAWFALGLVLEGIAWPLHWRREWRLDRELGLARLSSQQWHWDHFKGLCISGCIALVMLELVYGFMVYAPETWWLWSALASFAMMTLLIHIAPVMLVPLFYTCTPLEQPQLQARLEGLAQQCGAKLWGVYQIGLNAKTGALNAALAGLGRTRRVLLADTLLTRCTQDEIVAIIGHELGHLMRHHLIWLIIVQAMVVTGAFAVMAWLLPYGRIWLNLQGIDDVAGLPLVALLFFGVVIMALPLIAWISRWFEWQADRFALESTNLPLAFISALEKIKGNNLVEEDPPWLVAWLFHTHPSLKKRIEFASNWQAGNTHDFDSQPRP